MTKQSKSQATSNALGRADIFGPPPILEGEDAEAYNEILDRVFAAIRPTDVVEEILARDHTDVTWEKHRWRQALTTLINDEISEEVNKEAASLAHAQTEPLEGAEKEEMDALLDPTVSWEERAARYPRANETFQELFSSAKSAVDVDLIRAKVMRKNFTTIERFNGLIVIAQRRSDDIIRELDRHRFMKKQLNCLHDRNAHKLGIAEPKLIEGTASN